MTKVAGMLGKLWNRSPHQIYASVQSKLRARRPQPRWVEVASGPLKGGSLFIDPDSFIGWRRMTEGVFDEFIYRTLATAGNLQGKVFWDIGAHFGYHSLSVAALVGPTGKVTAFEPNPYNLQRLKLNVEKNAALRDRITVKDCALSDHARSVEFSFSKNVDDSRSSGSHLVSVAAPLTTDFYESFETTQVRAEKIDALLERGEVTPADIVKIDVEGAERLVLEGGRKFFAQHQPVVFMEVHNILMMCHCLNFLRDLGYRISVLDEHEATLSRCFIFAEPNKS